MNILIKDTVINLDRFIYAEISTSRTVRVWVEGLSHLNYLSIGVKNYEEGLSVLNEIVEKSNEKKN